MSRYRCVYLLTCLVFLFNTTGYGVDAAVAQQGLVAALSQQSAEPIRVGTAMQLAAEAKICSELQRPTKVEFIDTPLEDVLTYLEDYHEIEIEIDQQALDDLGVDSGTPINRSLSSISLRSVLSLILSSLDLTYVIEDEVLLITSVEEARTHVQTLVYPVGDLVHSAAAQGPHIDDLIEVISSIVAPEDSGMIVAFDSYLVIQHTEAAHEEIQRLLTALRKAVTSDN